MIQDNTSQADLTLVLVALQENIVGPFQKQPEMIMETKEPEPLGTFVMEVLLMKNLLSPFQLLSLEVLNSILTMDLLTQDILVMELQTQRVLLEISSLQRFQLLVYLVEKAITVRTQE